MDRISRRRGRRATSRYDGSRHVPIARPEGLQTGRGPLGRLERHLSPGALVVFDDIRLSRGMWRAWRAVEGRQGFALAADAGRFGLAAWAGAAATPVRHDLSLYFGFLRRVYAR